LIGLVEGALYLILDPATTPNIPIKKKMVASRIESVYTPMKSGIETAKISKKTPSPMVMCLTLFAMTGKVDKDGTDLSYAVEKPIITCF